MHFGPVTVINLKIAAVLLATIGFVFFLTANLRPDRRRLARVAALVLSIPAYGLLFLYSVMSAFSGHPI